MVDDAAFVRAIQAAPDDESVRLVYADWLEERGDARAEFLRVEVTALTLPATDVRRSIAFARLSDLRRDIDSSWLAVVSRLSREVKRAWQALAPKIIRSHPEPLPTEPQSVW